MEDIDFLIITALMQETQAVLQKLPAAEEIRDAETGQSFFLSSLPDKPVGVSQIKHSIVIAPLPGIGNNAASTTTAQALRKWQPRNVILVGVATGISEKVNLGDILIADSLINFETQKSLRTDPIYRTDTIKPSPVLISAIRHYATQDMSWKMLLKQPDLFGRDFGIHIGPLISSDKLFMGAEAFSKLKTDWPNLIGADMEASGVGEVISSMPSSAPNFLVVRSVSDAADGAKDDTWITYATDIAASFVIGFITSEYFSVPKTKTVQLIIEGSFQEFDQQRQADLVSVLSALLKIDTDDIKILKVHSG